MIPNITMIVGLAVSKTVEVKERSGHNEINYTLVKCNQYRTMYNIELECILSGLDWWKLELPSPSVYLLLDFNTCNISATCLSSD